MVWLSSPTGVTGRSLPPSVSVSKSLSIGAAAAADAAAAISCPLSPLPSFELFRFPGTSSFLLLPPAPAPLPFSGGILEGDAV